MHRLIVHSRFYNTGGFFICTMLLINMRPVQIGFMARLKAVSYMHHHGSLFCKRRMEVIRAFIVSIVITIRTEDLRSASSNNMQICLLGNRLELLDFLLKGRCTLLHGSGFIEASGAHLKDLNGSFPPEVLRIRNYGFV